MFILKNNTKGFTLIELLVVITIIGILATGATTAYTGQIQKARDTTRITDTKALQSSIEQVYQDSSIYPTAKTFSSGGTVSWANIIGVNTYMPRFPKDPKVNQTCNNGGTNGVTVICGYAYKSTDDKNGIQFGSYELSTALESLGNITSRAKTDNGEDDTRLEIWGLKTWSSNDNIITTIKVAAGSQPASGVFQIDASSFTIGTTAPSSDSDLILINGTL